MALVSRLLSMRDHDISVGSLSVSNSNVTTAFKVVGMAEMLGSADMDGLIEGNWDNEMLGEALVDGVADG